MKLQIQTEIRIKTILNELTDILNGYLLNWNSVESSLKAAYERLLYQKGEMAHYIDANGEFEGEIVGVQEDGRICLKVLDEIRYYSLKELQFCSK
jgi:biotin-(acetyl-CoA carboxylase) ligase